MKILATQLMLMLMKMEKAMMMHPCKPANVDEDEDKDKEEEIISAVALTDDVEMPVDYLFHDDGWLDFKYLDHCNKR